MSDNNNEFGAFMSGLLLGGIAGAITALLLAPQSGEETRKVILDKSLELKEKALETVEDARQHSCFLTFTLRQQEIDGGERDYLEVIVCLTLAYAARGRAAYSVRLALKVLR